MVNLIRLTTCQVHVILIKVFERALTMEYHVKSEVDTYKHTCINYVVLITQ